MSDGIYLKFSFNCVKCYKKNKLSAHKSLSFSHVIVLGCEFSYFCFSQNAKLLRLMLRNVQMCRHIDFYVRSRG